MREAKLERRHLMEVKWLDNGRPLPGTIHVQGIDHPITAGVEYGDFYRCAVRSSSFYLDQPPPHPCKQCCAC